MRETREGRERSEEERVRGGGEEEREEQDGAHIHDDLRGFLNLGTTIRNDSRGFRPRPTMICEVILVWDRMGAPSAMIYKELDPPRLLAACKGWKFTANALAYRSMIFH